MKRKRRKRDRLAPRERLRPGRLFRIYPDPTLPFVVEVRIARDIRRMREACMQQACIDQGPMCAGLVSSPRWKRAQRTLLWSGRVVARMFLNVHSLRDRPSEIIAHECTHAGMAWSRFRRANLGVMPGEEVLCYAVGEMVKQVNRIGYAAGIFR